MVNAIGGWVPGSLSACAPRDIFIYSQQAGHTAKLCTPAPCTSSIWHDTVMHPVRQSPTSYDGTTRPPGTQRKQSVTQAGKVHFCVQKCTCQHFTCCKKRVWKDFLAQSRSHVGTFWTLLVVYGSKKP